jgi:predicted transcriptional regulator
MNSTLIPGDVRRFILHCIPSVPFLEALLLLREDAAQQWTVQQLAQRLYLADAAAQALLRALEQAGMASAVTPGEGPWHYAPRTPDLAHILDKLAQVYARQLVDVSTLIHLKSNRKAQLFADAFVWRKDR